MKTQLRLSTISVIIVSFISSMILAVFVTGSINLNQKLNDYEGDLYTPLAHDPGSLEYYSTLEAFKIEDSILDEYEFTFYRLENKNIELHAVGYNSSGNCYISAMIYPAVGNDSGSIFKTAAYQGSDFEYDEEDALGKHSCSGDPCSRCRFVRSVWDNQIIGCRCANSGGHCNHTLSE